MERWVRDLEEQPLVASDFRAGMIGEHRFFRSQQRALNAVGLE